MNGTERRLSRCCDRHNDWTTLSEHLAAAFPDLPAADVFRELSTARNAIDEFRLDEADALDTAELIARHQLMLRSGQAVDGARLDPETRIRRQVVVHIEPV